MIWKVKVVALFQSARTLLLTWGVGRSGLHPRLKNFEAVGLKAQLFAGAGQSFKVAIAALELIEKG